MAATTHSHCRELRTQMSFAPAEVRARYARQFESLLLELAPQTDYPARYISFRVTGFEGEEKAGDMIAGDVLLADLSSLLDELSRDLREPADQADEPILDMAAVATRAHVSARTVRRWRMSGLPARWFRFGDGRLKLGVRESLFEQFRASHTGQMESSAQFSRLDEADRKRILELAARVRDETGGGITEVARRVAALVNRASETVRYTIREHDRTDPEHALFAPRRRRLTPEERRRVAERHRQGVPVRQLCRELGKSRSAVYAALQADAVERILSRNIRYVPNALFEASDADDVILGPEGVEVTSILPPLAGDEHDPDAFHAAVSQIPVLERARERELFRRYNYLKYGMARIQEAFRERGCEARAADRFEKLSQAAGVVRRDLINSNLRLLASIARRHAGPLVRFADLVSTGVLVIMRAVESFDYARGNKFSTYATWAISKEFARTVPEENYRLAAFQTGKDDLLRASGAPDEESHRREALAHLRHLLDKAVGMLSTMERDVIRARFGIDLGHPLTLSEVGERQGLSAERIRQIQNGALAKLRAILDTEALSA